MPMIQYILLLVVNRSVKLDCCCDLGGDSLGSGETAWAPENGHLSETAWAPVKFVS